MGDGPGSRRPLHELRHHPTSSMPSSTSTSTCHDLDRSRLRATSDAGTDYAIVLPRGSTLADGAVLLLEPDRAVVVRAGAPTDADLARQRYWGCTAARLPRRTFALENRPARRHRRGPPRGSGIRLHRPGSSSFSRVGGSSCSMTDLGQLLAAIRFGDSAFPSGGFAFSSGLEGSHRDGMVQDEDDVTAFVAEQLEGDWHRRDRVLLRRAWTEPDPSAADALAEAGHDDVGAAGGIPPRWCRHARDVRRGDRSLVSPTTAAGCSPGPLPVTCRWPRRSVCVPRA